ncbi:MAG TPA: A/G-specific adenine glycosylase [Candidatus Limnocylindria bacterium]|nr:A/G-specific adenine glycosylase [Candidatus Limnocylindria bacterium]
MSSGAADAMATAALDWYAGNGRDLAFRRTSDPWAILVSEVMAQQTQAARAAEAWTRFMAAYPTPAAMAATSPADVIRAWRGLGYNRRALALHRAARVIVAEHDGLVPGSLGALLALPGIGPYTARAVLAIAFNEPVAALDVNIRRVLGRAFGLDAVPVARRQAAADGHVPSTRAADWTHALMDIGAAFCRPRQPDCEACPLRPWCPAAGLVGAAATKTATKTAPPTTRFESTNRWLRGRILDALRDAPDNAWVQFDGAIGGHEAPAVAAALGALAAEGLIAVEAGRARLAVA